MASVLSGLKCKGWVVLPLAAGEQLAARWWQERGEETLMSEVRHVEDWICLATMQGHAKGPVFLSHTHTHAHKRRAHEALRN